MWPGNYWAAGYWAPRYWTRPGGTPPPPSEVAYRRTRSLLGAKAGSRQAGEE